MLCGNLKWQTTIKMQNKLFVLKRLLSSSSPWPAADYESALDYKLIPRPNILSFLRDFMPGGDFRDASFFDVAIGMRKRLGDIFVLPGMFGKPDMIMIYKPQDIETVFRNEGQWPKRQMFQSVQYFREKVKGDFFKETTGLIVTQGKEWSRMRSAVNPILMKPQNMVTYLKPLQEINNELIKRIKEIRDVQTLEVPANFEHELNRFTLESIALVALNRKLGLINGERISSDNERLFECTRLIFELTYKLDMQPSIWKIMRTPTFNKSMKVQEDLFRITQKYINETLEQIKYRNMRAEDKPEKYSSVLEKLLIIDEKLAVVTAMDLLMTGVDTTSATIIAILLCLAKNPEKQRKLRNEILQVMPSKETELNENNTKNLPYLRAVIKEAIRYYPNGTGSNRCPTQNIVLSGYQIPKDATVILNYNCLLKDEKFFPQADKFLPERWLRNETNKKIHFEPFSYLPFGIGPRVCVGRRLAELEMELAVLKLIRNFEIEFNYDASKPFKSLFLNIPCIPMHFTFKDINY